MISSADRLIIIDADWQYSTRTALLVKGIIGESCHDIGWSNGDFNRGWTDAPEETANESRRSLSAVESLTLQGTANKYEAPGDTPVHAEQTPSQNVPPAPAVSTSSIKRRRNMNQGPILPTHGSKDRPFRIENEDSVSWVAACPLSNASSIWAGAEWQDNEVTVDHNSAHKKKRIDLDYTHLE
jgi:hypothetical protein